MKITGTAAVRLLFFFALSLPGFCILQAQDLSKYLDPNLPVEQRIDDLLPRMTVAEKVSQISDSWGSVGVPRLKIPSLLKTEGLHSQSYSTGATLFPMPICMAATFDQALIGKVGRQTAIESKAAHLRVSWSPVLDVARDVRWGRVEETYGESPYLVSRMGVAWIDAFQHEGMIAVPKHFAGHGQPMGGRDSQDIGLSDRVMRTIHLPSFRAAIEEAHAGGIMAAYGLWDGVPDNASVTLLDTILRQEWGFDGMVVSDCGALQNLVDKQGIVRTMPQAAALGITAGVNMNCGRTYNSWAAKALDAGLITEKQLDDTVRPVLRAKFRLGLFEHPEPDKMVWDKLPAYDTQEARTLAREVSLEGQVLLKNDYGLLPLSKDIASVAVIGPDANVAQMGDYSPTPAEGQLITVLKAIRTHVGSSTRVLFAPGLDTPVSTDTSKFAEAIAAARQANVAIVVVGDNSHRGGGESTTGENKDGATLALPGAQRELIQAVQATGTPVVLVIVNGKPFTLEWEAAHIPAILVSWYPGEEGGDATADLLFGVRNPSGRLPLTWPRNSGQLPLNYDYLPSGRRYDYFDLPFAPQWRFGFGLSYTHYRYSNLRIAPKQGDPGFVTVSADVENTGRRDGDEVSQLYVTQMISSVATPVIELEGIQRISLKAGEVGTVRFELTPYQLSLLDSHLVRRVEPGQFRIHVGGVSPSALDDVTDERKSKVGFAGPEEGISGAFNESKAYSAQFVYTFDAPTNAENGQPFPAKVTVRNNGSLTDVTQVKLYAGFELGSWSFELKPGEEKSHTFFPVMYKSGSLAVVAGSQMITHEISLERAAARSDAQSGNLKWVGTWSASPMRNNNLSLPLIGKTLRQIVHTSIAGHTIRIHISNLYGTEPLTINNVHIARWSADSTIAADTDCRVLFGGLSNATIEAGSEAISDPLRFDLPSLADVAISFYVPDASGSATYHQTGFQTNYVVEGDLSGSPSLPNAKTTKSYFYLTNLDVQEQNALGTIVTFGASITDGYASTPDANLRWPNDLAQRLVNAGQKIGVLNQGISGNRLLVEGAGESAERRFDRDVLAQAGVRWVIFADDPINDLGSTRPQPTADQLIAGMKQLIDRAHAKHVKFLCSTLTPYEGAGYWNPSGEAARELINSFIRSKASGCDAVVDQDAATHDPTYPSRYLPAYDSGDHLHPNNAGLQAIADSVPIDRLAP